MCLVRCPIVIGIIIVVVTVLVVIIVKELQRE